MRTYNLENTMKTTKNYFTTNPKNKVLIKNYQQTPKINNDDKQKESSQSDLYDREKKLMFVYLNNLITSLTVEKDRLINFGN